MLYKYKFLIRRNIITSERITYYMNNLIKMNEHVCPFINENLLYLNF